MKTHPGWRIAPALAVLLLAGACSDDGKQAAPTGGSSSDPSVVRDDAPRIDPARNIPAVPLKQELKAGGLSMTVTEVRCGQRSVTFTGGGAPKQTITARSGNQICRISGPFRNLSQQPMPWLAFGRISAGNRQYAEDIQLSYADYQHAPQESKPTIAQYPAIVQPGAGGRFVAYYQVPSSIEPTAVLWPINAVAHRFLLR